jgi:hypothetical protein
LNKVKKYGIFVVPVGTVERWLRDLNVEVRNEKWISKILDKMEEENVKPIDNDVWKFMEEINEWIMDTNRSGMFLTQINRSHNEP